MIKEIKDIDNGDVLTSIAFMLNAVVVGTVAALTASQTFGWLELYVSTTWAIIAIILAAVFISVLLIVPTLIAVHAVVGWCYVRFAPAQVVNQFGKIIAGIEGEGPQLVLAKTSRRHFANLVEPTYRRLLGEYYTVRKALQQNSSDASRILAGFTERWTTEAIHHRSYASPFLHFTDPIHGTMEFDLRLAPIIMHPVVQRLHEVRQLFFAFLAFPGGTHTRFDHSLGAAHLASLAMTNVLEQGIVYTENGCRNFTAEERDDVRRMALLATVAALLHDVAHTPLGHTLDRFFGTKYLEGEPTADKALLPNILATHLKSTIDTTFGGVFTADDVARVLHGEDLKAPWEHFVFDLLDSALDVDRMDYLLRDAHFTGQREGLLNIRALLSAIRPFETKEGNIFLSFDQIYINDVEQFVYARDVMYLRCYEHPTKVVSEWLAIRAIEKFFERVDLSKSINEFALLTDAQLVEFVRLLDTDSSDLLRYVISSGAFEFKELASAPFDTSALTDRFRSLVDEYGKGTDQVLNMLHSIERYVASAAGIDENALVIVCPLPNVTDDRGDLDIRILTRAENGKYRTRLLPGEDEDNLPPPSVVMGREKWIRSDLVNKVTDLEGLRTLQAEDAKGFSLIQVIRKARSKVRVFIRRDVSERQADILAALAAAGMR